MVVFWATPRDAQGSLLAVFRGSDEMLARDGSQMDHVQGQCPPIVLFTPERRRSMGKWKPMTSKCVLNQKFRCCSLTVKESTMGVLAPWASMLKWAAGGTHGEQRRVAAHRQKGEERGGDEGREENR